VCNAWVERNLNHVIVYLIIYANFVAFAVHDGEELFSGVHVLPQK